MNRTILTSVFSFSFLLSTAAFALVDMRNANYSATWVDLDLPGSGYQMRVSRTYNSRTLFNGIFGFGWCSDFETKIDVTPEGNLKLSECGAGQETFYYPREFARKDIDATVAKIMAAVRAAKKIDEKAMKNLQQDLPNNNSLRSAFARELKIAIPVKEGTIFFANGKEVESIQLIKGFYKRTLVDGTAQVFAREGKMVQLFDKNGNYLKFDYKDQSLTEISDNNGRRLSVKYYNNKKVRSIAGPNSINVDYKYENLDDLSYVKNSTNQVFTYAYDDQHNLTKATFPAMDGMPESTINITYDKKRDWVTSFQDRDGCLEQYTYDSSETDPKNHYWSLVKKTCNKEVVTESKYEFFHKVKPSGERYLYRVSSVINNNATEVTYHETFGKPISILRNGQQYSYDYYPNGQVKTKLSKVSKLVYEYGKDNNKVAAVVAVGFNEKGKPAKTISTKFRYDKKGNLIWAANSDGQNVEMTYDNKGRISTIKDQAKKYVKIAYDEKTGRPGIVTRPGLGAINVSYKNNGEIEKVNSKEGPSVAMQVASTFNNLLEIISPATAEIYN